MPTPDFKAFSRLARDYTLVPVSKVVRADMLTPVSAFLAIAADEPEAFLLESVEGGEKIGRYTFLGVRPNKKLTARGTEIRVQTGKRSVTHTGGVFENVKTLLREHRAAPTPGLPPFTSGAVGFFSYDVVRQLEILIPHIDFHDFDA